MFKKLLIMLTVLIIVAINPGIAHAESSDNTLKINWIEGPKTVDVGNDLAKLDLPDDYVFADGNDAKKLMKEMGNSVTDREQGIVFAKDTNQEWFALFEFDDMGYVKDNDASKIDADKLLSEIKQGTEEENKERIKNGKPTMDIIGWDEKPHYDSNTHNLIWSILANSEGKQIVNYNVRLLGRGGVTEVTLVADKSEMTNVKPKLETIISKYSYKEGKKYSDYIKGDKMAEAGLTALIAGGAGAGIAKAGLLAKILLIFKKIWILIIIGIGGLFKGIAGRFKKKPNNGNGSNLNSGEILYKENSYSDAINEISSTSVDSKSENDRKS